MTDAQREVYMLFLLSGGEREARAYGDKCDQEAAEQEGNYE